MADEERLFTRRFLAYRKESQWYVKVPCIECSQQLEIPINIDHFDQWILKQNLIQYAMPELSADLRELFLSGICPICWDAMFKEQ